MTDVSDPTIVTTEPLTAIEGLARRPWRNLMHNPVGVAAMAYLLAVTLLAIFAPLIAPYDPLHQNLLAIFQSPSTTHLLGTDDLGRDVLSRLIYGARVSMAVGVISVGFSLVIAVPIGFLAGYRGGLLDRLVQILVDVMLAIPPLILVFAIAGVLGPSVTNLIIALAVFFVPLFMRLTRQETNYLRHSQLVEAERALGLTEYSIAWRHVLPNIASALTVQVAANIGIAIIAEAALSFLGLGVRPPSASWGVMLRTSYEYMTSHPFLLVPPAVAVLLTVLAFNLLADALRDAFGQGGR
ncbi:MAG TPA: ABC transporter permease [Acidimicrobiales bacterium]|jgi:peptide/nickel transport system permease protein